MLRRRKRASGELTSSTHFVSVDKQHISQRLPGPVENPGSLNATLGSESRYSANLDASANIVMPGRALRGPTHLSPLSASKRRQRRRGRERSSADLSELDTFDDRLKKTGTEWSIRQGPQPGK